VEIYSLFAPALKQQPKCLFKSPAPSDASAKMLKLPEDAHPKSLSTFETDEPPE
jgi:hypothetical protein